MRKTLFVYGNKECHKTTADRIKPKHSSKHAGCTFQNYKLLAVQETKKNDENSGFSYVVIKRGKKPQFNNKISFFKLLFLDHSDIINHPYWSRIVENPIKGSGHVDLKVCSSDGKIKEYTVSKKWGKMIYRDAKKARIGELFPHKHLSESQYSHK